MVDLRLQRTIPKNSVVAVFGAEKSGDCGFDGFEGRCCRLATIELESRLIA